MKIIPLTLLCIATLLAPQVRATEQDTVDQAANIIERFKSLPERGIPARVLRDAKGVAILSVVKGGFIWSGRIGEGVVVARTKNGWSGPAFIRTGGAGFGPQIGGKVTEFVFILNTMDAVRAFEHGGNIALGGDLSVAAGPLGRTAEAGVMPKAAIYAYSRSQGLFAGASLEGTVVVTNQHANERYYGRNASPRAILTGRIPPPRGTERLRHLL